MIRFFIFILCALCQIQAAGKVQTPEDMRRLAYFQSLFDVFTNGHQPVGEIPKVLHVIALGPHSLSLRAEGILRTWIDKHPGWHIKLWTDRTVQMSLDQVEVMTANQFPLQNCADCYYSAESFEERSLLLRYAILLQEGGVYVEQDVECLSSIEPMRVVCDFFCGLEPIGASQRSSSVNPACHLIGATKGHPILKAVQEIQVSQWQSFEKLFPGTDSLSIASRILHRSVQAFSLAIEKAAATEGRKDCVFPPEYFSSSDRKEARYALAPAKALFGRRIEQSQNKEKIEDAFTAIRNQLKFCLYLICALAALNIVLGAIVFHLYKKNRQRR
jgi:hypothetical protein